MSAYYNENDKGAAAWLRELIAAGHIAPGDVDDRSIEDVTADDLRGYAQCHFFAGIGGWSHALRLAGWPDDRPVWTGSCPCQPFSAAGKGGGFDDKRHLWPVFFDLIAECAPDVVLGEQVASPLGLSWLDHVCADLEGAGYAAGAVDTCAAGFGAPHIRQRLYWAGVGRGERLGDAAVKPGQRIPGSVSKSQAQINRQRQFHGRDAVGSKYAGSGFRGLAQPDDPLGRADPPAWHDAGGAYAGRAQGSGDAQTSGGGGRLADGDVEGLGVFAQRDCEPSSGREVQRRPDHDGCGDLFGLVGGTARPTHRPAPASPAPRLDDDHGDGTRQALGSVPVGLESADGDRVRPGPTNGFWRDSDWLGCRDGKWRPVEPGTFPLAHGVSARVGRLRGYGNAIVAQQAAAFCEAVMEAVS